MCLEHYLLFPDEPKLLAKLVGKYTSFKLTVASIVFFVLLIVLLTRLILIIIVQKRFNSYKN